MSVPESAIGMYSLSPGQWVTFAHSAKSIPEKLKGPFKVINRDDFMWGDPCRCRLMDTQGKLWDYCPRQNRLESENLPENFSFTVLNKEEIAKKLGHGMASLQSAALKHLKNLATTSVLFGRGFNPADETTTLTKEQVMKQYGLNPQESKSSTQ